MFLDADLEVLNGYTVNLKKWQMHYLYMHCNTIYPQVVWGALRNVFLSIHLHCRLGKVLHIWLHVCGSSVRYTPHSYTGEFLYTKTVVTCQCCYFKKCMEKPVCRLE